MAARHEGLLLDPVYAAKTMAGLVAHVRAGRIARGSRVLFVHTGGLPALFAYADSLGSWLSEGDLYARLGGGVDYIPNHRNLLKKMGTYAERQERVAARSAAPGASTAILVLLAASADTRLVPARYPGVTPRFGPRAILWRKEVDTTAGRDAKREAGTTLPRANGEVSESNDVHPHQEVYLIAQPSLRDPRTEADPVGEKETDEKGRDGRRAMNTRHLDHAGRLQVALHNHPLGDRGVRRPGIPYGAVFPLGVFALVWSDADLIQQYAREPRAVRGERVAGIPSQRGPRFWSDM